MGACKEFFLFLFFSVSSLPLCWKISTSAQLYRAYFRIVDLKKDDLCTVMRLIQNASVFNVFMPEKNDNLQFQAIEMLHCEKVISQFYRKALGKFQHLFNSAYHFLE